MTTRGSGRTFTFKTYRKVVKYRRYIGFVFQKSGMRLHLTWMSSLPVDGKKYFAKMTAH